MSDVRRRDYVDDGLELQEIAPGIDNETGERVILLRLGPRGLAQPTDVSARSMNSVDFRLSPREAERVGRILVDLGRELAGSTH